MTKRSTVKVVSINIWNRQGPWERRLPLLRGGLAALDADLIGMQEVMVFPGVGDQAAELGLPHHIAHAPALLIAGGPMSVGNTLLSRWPIVEATTVPLPVERAEEGRSLLCAVVEAPMGRLPVYVTHLTWQLHLGHGRQKQVRLIDDLIQERMTKDSLPPILLGDFNAEPDSDEMRFLRGLTAMGGRSTYWADCWGVCGAGPGYTYSRENGYALETREPSRRIDYVFVRGPDRHKRGEPRASRVVLDDALDGAWPSDHYGVYAEISL